MFHGCVAMQQGEEAWPMQEGGGAVRTIWVLGMWEREGGMSACRGSKKPMRWRSRCSTVWRRMVPCSSKGSALSKAFFTSGVTGKAWCEQHRSVSSTCRTCIHPVHFSQLPLGAPCLSIMAFFASGITGKAWSEQQRSVSTTCRTCPHPTSIGHPPIHAPCRSITHIQTHTPSGSGAFLKSSIWLAQLSRQGHCATFLPA